MSNILRMKRKGFWIWMCSCLCMLQVQAQVSDLQQAAYWEGKGDFATAAAYYEDYLRVAAEPGMEIRFAYAHCLRRLYEYRQAERQYAMVWENAGTQYPDALFYLALMKKHRAVYDSALMQFRLYGQMPSGNAVLKRRVPIEIEGCQQAVEDLKRPADCRIWAPPVNSGYSEFNARLSDDSLLYFSAMRHMTQNGAVQWIGDYYQSQIYSYSLRNGGQPKPLPRVLNHPKYHNANACFNAAQTRIYFTRSPLEGATDGAAEIWVSEKKEGKWQKAWRLDEPVNLPQSVSTHPFVCQINGRDVLYFVSDRAGGRGGLDIWYAVQDTDGRFREATNAGSVINSEGNEITPFYHSATHTLYFSSDHYAGMGGYDIFAAEGGLSAWKQPLRHLPPPFNSPANDLYFILTEKEGNGFFSSNRHSPYALSDAACCNDIYAFSLPEKKRRVVRRDTLWAESAATVSAKSLLPLTLYFHNDEPDPRSLSDTTLLDYQRTLQDYLALQQRYEKQSAQGYEDAAAVYAVVAVRRFFEDSLSGAYRKLQDFMDYLRQDLTAGHHVYIQIDGFASPLHTSEYNRHLSSRRIQCLWNSLCGYRQGFFLPYLRSGQLKVAKRPQGKELAKASVSEDPGDLSRSVYSIPAALERRIQITRYESDASLGESEEFPLSMPDTNLSLLEHKGTDLYELSLQLKNRGGETIQLDGFRADGENVKIRCEQLQIKPDEYLFLTIEYPAEVFDDHSSIAIVFNCKSNNCIRKIRFHTTFLKQK